MWIICISLAWYPLSTQFFFSRLALSINWFFIVLFYVVTNVKTSKPLPLLSSVARDKENVSANNNRAIVAITIVKKPPGLAGLMNKTSMLKNMMKKSMSVPNSLYPNNTMKTSNAQTSKPAITVISHTAVKKVIDPATVVQRQHEYAELAKKRKEQLIQKINKEIEKELQVKFTANPAPRFKKVQVVAKQPLYDKKKLVKQNSLPQFSTMMKKSVSKENVVPSCGDPERIRFMEERKKRNMEKYHEPIVNFKAKPAAVLKKQPFQPVHNVPKTIEAKPFKLQLAERVLMRSEFDKKLQETSSIRRKQEEIRKHLADFEERRIIRQKTEFRANPMPFNKARSNH